MRIERFFTAHEPLAAPKDFQDAFESALYPSIPTRLKPIEENRTPSWLWQRRAASEQTHPERDAQKIIDRVAGAATHKAWKQDFFKNEAEASVFYDETRFLLSRRMLAIEPQSLMTLGTDWAYGAPLPAAPQRTPRQTATPITNTTLDAILRGDDPHTRREWKTLLRDSKTSLALTFADTQKEWTAEETTGTPRALLDLLQFRRAEDGSLDIHALQQATRLGVLLLDLHYEQLAGNNATPSRALALGYANLSALLVPLGLAYDSAAGRATAAAITAIIAAEATATSARLARLLGPSLAFIEHRSAHLRTLRNRRRAAYGERNDYERLSILPAPLDIDSGVDLVSIAAARRGWDEALDLVQEHGLRHEQTTALFATSSLIPLLDGPTQGVESMALWVRERQIAPDIFRREIHPAVPMALRKIGCDPADRTAIINHVVGHGTLVAAPAINHAHLRERGFTAEALARLEEYLPRVNTIRTAFTPWVLGARFCRESLGLKDKDLFDPRFDLLHHLGFTAASIAVANAFCCGHGGVVGATELPSHAKKIFATTNTHAAKTRMAAAVQPFLDAPLALTLPLSAEATMEERASLLIAAWRQGLRHVTLAFDDSAPKPALSRKKLLARKPILVAPVPPLRERRTTSLMTSSRAAKPKATPGTLNLKSKTEMAEKRV